MLNLANSPYPVKRPDLPMDLSRMAALDPAKIKYCIWHHVGAPTDDNSGAEQTNKYHRETNGWAGIGYHGQIRWDGTLELGRPLMKQGVHTKNHNHESIAFVFSGNFSIADIMTRPKQYLGAVALAKIVSQAYPGIRHVNHKILRPTSCNGDKFPWKQFIADIARVEDGNDGKASEELERLNTIIAKQNDMINKALWHVLQAEAILREAHKNRP